MPREPATYLHDMAQAAARIRRFLHGKTFADYLEDELLRAGVERQFEIIGEALNRLMRLSPEMAGRIPASRRIIGFRNVLIHGYATIDDKLVWGIVEGKLPALEAAVAELLKEVGPAPD